MDDGFEERRCFGLILLGEFLPIGMGGICVGFEIGDETVIDELFEGTLHFFEDDLNDGTFDIRHTSTLEGLCEVTVVMVVVVVDNLEIGEDVGLIGV